MKTFIMASALVITSLFAYAEKEEVKENKIKQVIELFSPKEEVQTISVLNKKDMIDIKPFIKPEKEVEEDLFN